MDSSTRIAGAIVLTALLLFFLFVGYREFERQRDIDEATAAIQQLNDSAKQALADNEAGNAQRAEIQREQTAVAWRRRQLEGGQQCIGGVVVVVEGSNYTQLGSVGDPVRCKGSYADRPIR